MHASVASQAGTVVSLSIDSGSKHTIRVVEHFDTIFIILYRRHNQNSQRTFGVGDSHLISSLKMIRHLAAEMVFGSLQLLCFHVFPLCRKAWIWKAECAKIRQNMYDWKVGCAKMRQNTYV